MRIYTGKPTGNTGYFLLPSDDLHEVWGAPEALRLPRLLGLSSKELRDHTTCGLFLVYPSGRLKINAVFI